MGWVIKLILINLILKNRKGVRELKKLAKKILTDKSARKEKANLSDLAIKSTNSFSPWFN